MFRLEMRKKIEKKNRNYVHKLSSDDILKALYYTFIL